MNDRRIDIAGQIFGRLTAVSFAGVDREKSRWVYRCACGTEEERFYINVMRTLKNGGEPRCKKCYAAERHVNGGQNKTHGLSKGVHNKIYHILMGMKRRCYSQTCKDYPDYGGRGIIVSAEWSGSAAFIDWALGNGYQEGYSIERNDVNGNYEPGNCRWIPMSMQARNKRDTMRVEYMGENLSVAEWADRTGIGLKTLKMRVNLGWSPERILFVTPRLGRNQYSSN